MSRSALGVWLHGVQVGTVVARRPGEVRFAYDDEAVAASDRNAPLLSCSLPVRRGAQDGRAFFAGLLPEGRALQAMADQAGCTTADTVGLLARFGRDVAGAVVVGDEMPERVPAVMPYGVDGLAEAVAALPERPLDLHDDSELSIAGLQDKLLLVRLDDGTWARPINGRASTHILKVEDRRYPGMAEREVAAAGLARAVGLTGYDTRLEVVAGLPCVVVERFDRAMAADGSCTRLHQEDTCQALGRDPFADRHRGKYHAHGGPALREVAQVLDRWAVDPVAELERLLRLTTFTVVIGNADAHGKNLAVLHPEPGRVTLAPAYDTVPTALWPNLRRTPAMPIGPRPVEIDQIRTADLVDEGVLWRMDRDLVGVVVSRCLDDLAQAARVVPLPADLAALVATNLDRLARTDRT